ncbi:MAG: hypothetical protein C0407_08860 [Desulfobacca sp.]|nr:hypothetical protein [Desulfobacca sp.]
MAMYPLSLSNQKPLKIARIWFGGLLLLFLISILGFSYHHHNDSSSSADCPICLAVDQPFLTKINTGLVQFLFRGIHSHCPATIQFPSNLFTDFNAPRAPPTI